MKDRRGSLLVTTLVVVVLTGLLAGSLATYLNTQLRLTRVAGADLQAYYAARAAIAHALARLQADPAWRGRLDSGWDGTHYTATVHGLTITATGSSGGRSVRLGARLRVEPPPVYSSVYDGGSLHLYGGSQVRGDLAAAGDLLISGASRVSGAARAGGSISVQGAAGADGGLFPHAAPPAPPPLDLAALRGAATQVERGPTVIGGLQAYTDEVIWVEGDLTLSGSIRGRVLFAADNVLLAGDLLAEGPASAVVIIARGEVDLKNAAAVTALVYALGGIDAGNRSTVIGGFIDLQARSTARYRSLQFTADGHHAAGSPFPLPGSRVVLASLTGG